MRHRRRQLPYPRLKPSLILFALWLSVSSQLAVIMGIIQPEVANALTGSVVSSPGTCTSVAGTGTTAWTNPANALTDNGTAATARLNGTTHDLRCRGFSFSPIPTNATITGVTANVKRMTSKAGNTFSEEAMLIGTASTKIGASQTTATAWSTSYANATYGGSTNLWGGVT